MPVTMAGPWFERTGYGEPARNEPAHDSTGPWGLVCPLALINLTPGHLGFPGCDGYGCYIAHASHASLPACEQVHPLYRDGLSTQRLLASLSHLDFNQ